MTRHTCEWTPTPDGFACAECDATTPQCINEKARGGPHPTRTNNLICDPCLQVETWVLDDIAAALEWWDPRDAYRRKSPMAFDLTRATGTSHNRLRTPDDVRAELIRWATIWASHSGGSNGETAAEFLTSRHLWAAHNPDTSRWHDYRREVRKLRHAARAIAGLTPDRHPEACMHCGGRIVQDRSDHEWQPLEHGLADTIRCTGCSLTWNDRAAFQRNVRHHIWALPHDHPDELVTVDQAAAIYPDVPRGTFRRWLHYDRKQKLRELPERDWTARGEPLYRLADFHAKVLERTRGGRRGKPARPA